VAQVHGLGSGSGSAHPALDSLDLNLCNSADINININILWTLPFTVKETGAKNG
jgi:hypothetical protein